MHKEHKKLLVEIKKYRRKNTKHSENSGYINSGHIYYSVPVPIRRQIARDWLRENKGVSKDEFLAVVDSLYQGKSHEEKTLASILLGYHDVYRKAAKPTHLNRWLDHLVGWAEVDSLCQNVFTAEELLSNWRNWKSFIQKLAKDKNINKRRASLVLLTGPTYRSNDKKLSGLAFEVIDRLKNEKPIIITKAISWLLRDMSNQHKKDVVTYLKENGDSLPKIAVRETWRKIKTGRK